MPSPDSQGNGHDDESRKPSDTSNDSRGSGWIDKLAQRSTGLPAEESHARPADDKNDSKLWRLAGLGFQFAASVVLFAYLGYLLDEKMGWSPWGLVTLCLLAVVGNLYLLIKVTLKEDAPPRAPRKPK